MSQALINKIKKGRQKTVESQGKKFIIRRPTDYEVSQIRDGSIQTQEVMFRFVEGWEDMTELDLIPNGLPDLIPFSLELWREWIVDHPEHWAAINDGVLAAWTEYSQRREEVEKK